MCKECGCGHEGGANTRLQFIVHGYTEEIAQEVETELLGMPGVMRMMVRLRWITIRRRRSLVIF